jgi:DNA-binding CsgD family transcriptional regulator
MAKEQMQKMLSSRRDRRILEMRLKGARFADIAKAMGMHERTVRQIVGEIEAEAMSEIKVQAATS